MEVLNSLATIPFLADVFVSYSRQGEIELVDRLQDALAARDVSCWVDREDIFPSSPWRSEIDQAILESHAFIFVISPSSVASPYCRAELERAVALAKRLVPVLAKDTRPELVPPALAELQFISFTQAAAGDEAAFDRQLSLLVEALSTDVETLHFHTRLLTQAERWVQKDNDHSLLLRGRELIEAEKWLDEQTSAGRPVLSQQQRLVRDSRQAAIRRQRGSVTVAVAISAVMALLAVLTAVEWHVAVNQRHQAQIERNQAQTERNQAQIERNQAEVQRDRASSLYVAQESQGQLSVDPQLALVLALRADDFSPTGQAQDAVRAAVGQSSLVAAVAQAAKKASGLSMPAGNGPCPATLASTTSPPLPYGARCAARGRVTLSPVHLGHNRQLHQRGPVRPRGQAGAGPGQAFPSGHVRAALLGVGAGRARSRWRPGSPPVR